MPSCTLRLVKRCQKGVSRARHRSGATTALPAASTSTPAASSTTTALLCFTELINSSGQALLHPQDAPQGSWRSFPAHEHPYPRLQPHTAPCRRK